jgi:hypothetical protein
MNVQKISRKVSESSTKSIKNYPYPFTSNKFPALLNKIEESQEQSL